MAKVVSEAEKAKQEEEGWDVSPDESPSSSLVKFHDELDDYTYDELVDMGAVSVTDVDEVSVIEKSELEGKPFVLLEWRFTDGDFGEFAAIKIRTAGDEYNPDGKLHVFVDGSSGIKEQLLRYEDRLVKKGKWEAFLRTGMVVPNGLRASHYVKELVGSDGVSRPTPCTTYYIDNRPRTAK